MIVSRTFGRSNRRASGRFSCTGLRNPVGSASRVGIATTSSDEPLLRPGSVPSILSPGTIFGSYHSRLAASAFPGGAYLRESGRIRRDNSGRHDSSNPPEPDTRLQAAPLLLVFTASVSVRLRPGLAAVSSDPASVPAKIGCRVEPAWLPFRRRPVETSSGVFALPTPHG